MRRDYITLRTETVDGHVLLVTLNRPEVSNAINTQMGRDLLEQVMASSDPTLRAVFAEDAAALTGLVIAAVGLAAHQATGSVTPDAVGSILIGVLLAVVLIGLLFPRK